MYGQREGYRRGKGEEDEKNERWEGRLWKEGRRRRAKKGSQLELERALSGS